MFAVVRVESGILEGVTLFEDREVALRFGKDQFEEATGWQSMAQALDCDAAEVCAHEPDYDEEWGGISRGHVMHWLTDNVDVWVTEPDAPVGLLTTTVGQEGDGGSTIDQPQASHDEHDQPLATV